MSNCTSEPLDLGQGLNAELRYLDGVLQGMWYEHPCRNGQMSPGWIPFKPECPSGWTLVSEKPLTLSPSLLCPMCGHHGFVRDGRWVPA